MESVCGGQPADGVAVRRVEHSQELSSQSPAVRVLARVRVVEEQNHQQEEHINQEILRNETTRHQDWEAKRALVHPHLCTCSQPPSAWCAACELCGPAAGPGTEQSPEGVSPWRPVGPPSQPGGIPPARPAPPDAADAHTLRNRAPHTPPVWRSGSVNENTAQQGAEVMRRSCRRH